MSEYDPEQVVGLANRLLKELMADDDHVGDVEVFQRFEKLTKGHSLFAQLLSVALVVQLAKELPQQVKFMSQLSASLEDAEPSMSVDQRLKAFSTMSRALKSTSDALASFNASKEASGALVASLNEVVGTSDTEAGTSSENVQAFLKMTPQQRHRVMRGLSSQIQNIVDMVDEDEDDD